VKLTTHLHLETWLRMSGAVLLLPHMPSQRGEGQLQLLSLTDATSTLEVGAGFATESWNHAARSSWLQVIADYYFALL